MSRFRRDEEREVYRNERLVVYDDVITRPDGSPGRYFRLSYHNNPRGAVIVPRLPDGRLLLVQVHRYAVDHDSWEFPRGGGRVGEGVEATARRELKTETGLDAETIELLGFSQPDGAIIMTEVGVFLAMLREGDDSCVEVNPDEGILGFQFVSERALRQLVRDGAIKDGFTLSALALIAAQSG